MVPKKLCPGCNTEKPANIKYFIRSPRYEDNLKPLCIECIKRETSAKNRPRMKAYREANKEELKQKGELSKLFDPKRYFLNTARNRAKAFGLAFNLTYETMPEIPDRCPVFGFPLKLGVSRGRLYPNSVTLDRIEPDKGYTQGNVQFLSWRANELKRNGTLEEFEQLVAFWRKQK